jgi:hypothetical protein
MDWLPFFIYMGFLIWLDKPKAVGGHSAMI